jgi:hypothetical protein
MPITTISRTNTIDEWRIQTNQSASALNSLETGAYVKSNGTLTLTNTSSLIITAQGTSLQVANSALIQRDLNIGNELDVGVQSSDTGNVTVGNILVVLGRNDAFQVANNAVLNSARVNTNVQIAGTLSTNLAYSNNSVVNSNIEIVGTASANNVYANNLTVNTSMTIGNTVTSLNLVSNLITTDDLVVRSLLTVEGNGVVEGNLVVQGTLIQTGNTEITTDTIAINTGTVVNKNAFIENRRVSGNNAIIKWDEVAKSWQVSSGNTYTTLYNILDASTINTSPIATSDLTVPSSSALRTAYLTAGGYANSAFVRANTAQLHANAAFTAANNAVDTWVRDAANSASSYANSSFVVANTASVNSTSASSYANGAFTRANTAQTHANSGYTHANGAFTRANTISDTAISASSYANSAYTQANTATTNASSAQTHASAAFNFANTRFSASGGTISGNVAVTGNFTVSGTTTFINTTQLNIGDNIITLNADVSTGSTPTENAGIEINRGSSANVFVRWNETTDRWEFTNNGSTYSNIGSAAAESFANSAYAQANTGTILAQASFNFANTVSSTVNATNRDQQMNSLGVGIAPSTVPGEILAIDNITAYASSDRRLKENIVNISNAIEKVQKLNGVEYDWIDAYIEERGGEDDYFVRKHDIGLIAQEVEEVLPEIVADRPNGYKAIKYERVVALLVEAIKELTDRLDKLENK